MTRFASGRATWARVVEVAGDRFAVHLVVEVGPAGGDPEYRAPTTVCGLVGYLATERRVSACPECERALPDALPSARQAAACRRADWEAGSWRN
jgi:hypothetical protein